MICTLMTTATQASMREMQRQYGKQRSVGMLGYCVL